MNLEKLSSTKELRYKLDKNHMLFYKTVSETGYGDNRDVFLEETVIITEELPDLRSIKVGIRTENKQEFSLDKLAKEPIILDEEIKNTIRNSTDLPLSAKTLLTKSKIL